MQPTVRRARRTADTRGYAHRERAARWGRPRPEHPPGFVEIAGCGKRSAAPISARRAVMGGRARAERRSRPGASPPRRIVHVSRPRRGMLSIGVASRSRCTAAICSANSARSCSHSGAWSIR